jgi:hypothetical protein
MPLQYVSDASGNHTAVLIPITEWELLTRKHADLRALELPQNPLKNKNPSDYAGSMPRQVAETFIRYVEEERNHWD